MFVDRVFIRVVETRGAYEAVIKEVVTSSCVVFEGERRKETGFRFCNDIPFITSRLFLLPYGVYEAPLLRGNLSILKFTLHACVNLCALRHDRSSTLM